MLHRFFLLLVVATCGPAYLFGQDFVLEDEAEGIAVYTRGEEDNQLSVRVITVVRTDVPTVQRTLDDAANYREWVHRCDGAYIVAGGAADDYVFVSGIDMPFPFRDKEVVARVTQELRTNGTLVRTIAGKPEAVAHTGRDRPTVYDGEWIITPLPNGEVNVQVTVRTDAGAGLPQWLRKEVLTGGPVKTVANLRRRLEAAK